MQRKLSIVSRSLTGLTGHLVARNKIANVCFDLRDLLNVSPRACGRILRPKRGRVLTTTGDIDSCGVLRVYKCTKRRGSLALCGSCGIGAVG